MWSESSYSRSTSSTSTHSSTFTTLTTTSASLLGQALEQLSKMSCSEVKVATSKVLEVIEVDEIQFIEPGPGSGNTSIQRLQNVEVQEPGEISNVPEVCNEPISPGSDSEENGAEDGQECNPKRGFRFWCIMMALASTSILSALEGTIVSTALPTIVGHLRGAELFIWTVNGYFLTR